MTQRRIQDFGSPVAASSLKNLSASVVTSAVLSGNDFLVDAPDRMRINPGSAVTHQGVVIIEDEPKFLNVVNTSSPADYTVYYDHTDANVSGGVPAVLTLASGLLTASAISGVILGYVRYPGLGIPLAQSHFIQVLKTRLGDVRYSKENADWVIPIRNSGYVTANAVGGPIDITDVFDTGVSPPSMYVRLRNNTGSSASLSLVFPFKVGEVPYSLLQIVIGTDINALVTPSFVDSDGTVFVLTTAPFPNNPNLQLKTVDISRESIQIANRLVFLQLAMVIASNREVKIQAIGLNQYNLPV